MEWIFGAILMYIAIFFGKKHGINYSVLGNQEKKKTSSRFSITEDE